MKNLLFIMVPMFSSCATQSYAIDFTKVFTEMGRSQTTNSSGVKPINVKVKTNAQGLTIEQANVAKRLIEDNKFGSYKHLYVISPYSGDVVLYSMVDGKVSSSGKRTMPKTVTNTEFKRPAEIKVGGQNYYTNELMGEDGTYGSSTPYIYWWDTKGFYHQHMVTGGQIIHISDQPLAVQKVIINIDNGK